MTCGQGTLENDAVDAQPLRAVHERGSARAAGTARPFWWRAFQLLQWRKEARANVVEAHILPVNLRGLKHKSLCLQWTFSFAGLVEPTCASNIKYVARL